MSAFAQRLFALGLASVTLVACSAIWGFDDLRRAGPNDDGGADADAGQPPNPDADGNQTANKVDLLFVVDTSATMEAKRTGLLRSLDELYAAVISSNDVHVGVLTGALRSSGADVCTSDDRGRLVGGGFVDYKDVSTVDQFPTYVSNLMGQIDRVGCAFQSPLESLYRFLSAPDPWEGVTVTSDKALYSGLDDQILAQRERFLRPDSLLVIVLITDREDASVDPLSFGGLGWAFAADRFPGSVRRPNGKETAPRATSVCSTNPADPACTSCKCIDEPCPGVAADPSCAIDGGYYGPNEDWLAVRFHKMKQRYGRDPQYPVERYVKALTKVRVPRRSDEHPETNADGKRRIADYDSEAATCTNPLFAAKLPKSSAEEWCNLPIGPRGKGLVLFGVIGGVPQSLIGGNGAPTSWTSVLGSDPAGYSDVGKDKHMIQSTNPRDGLAPPTATRGDNGVDPVHGREYETDGQDLQYACTANIAPVTCDVTNQLSCECGRSFNPPLCSPTSVNTQIMMKAYPSVRQLRVARDLGGDRAVVGSVCVTPEVGYRATLSVLAGKIYSRLGKK